jgi:hypothetical protein
MNTKFCAFTTADKAAMKDIFTTVFDIDDQGLDKLFKAYEKFDEDFISQQKSPPTALSEGAQSIEREKILPKQVQEELEKKFMDNAYIIGIDLPVILTPENGSGKTVFIVAEDPLRGEQFRNDPKVILSTPFGIHRERIKVYWLILDNLLQKGYSVYLTDIHKLWLKDKDHGKIKLQGALLDNFKRCLKKEIDYFNPELIITYGNPAKDSIEGMQLSTQVSSFLHPSPSANASWKKIFVNTALRCTADNKSAHINSLVNKLLDK